MPKWEYKILSSDQSYSKNERRDKDFEQELNKLGNKGWELVGILHATGGNGILIEARFILKRQVNE